MERFFVCTDLVGGGGGRNKMVCFCSAPLVARKLAVETEKTYPSYFRTITQLSLHTLHTAVTGSLQGGGRLRAFVGKRGGRREKKEKKKRPHALNTCYF